MKVSFILPFTGLKVQILQSVVSSIDGLLSMCGGDISPVIYGESTLPECGECCRDRDDFDYALLRLASERQIPVLFVGECRLLILFWWNIISGFACSISLKQSSVTGCVYDITA